MLFQEKINGREDWARLFQSIEAFRPLIERIFTVHDLPYTEVTHCTPGTNAVFCVGAYIIKIFAPMESGFSTGEDYQTERFGLSRAEQLGARAPRLAAAGTIEDSYRFDYLVMEAVPGQELGEVTDSFPDETKQHIGSTLRAFVSEMDTPCEKFTTHRLRGPEAEARWESFPAAFRAEREAYLSSAAFGAPGYIHGDLTCDNILVTPEGELCVIDYADALIAPPEVELACVICEAFQLDKAYLTGFFGAYDPAALAETCLSGLLLHDFGKNIIHDHFGEPQEIADVAALRELIRRALA